MVKRIFVLERVTRLELLDTVGHADMFWGLKQRKNRINITFTRLNVGAGYEARTRYLHLGKVALYQMS